MEIFEEYKVNENGAEVKLNILDYRSSEALKSKIRLTADVYLNRGWRLDRFVMRGAYISVHFVPKM
ncbi:hypothetical protein JXA02_02325 [candidate division KSB1 bacterium]|nr:hypothetical protein [candidate division KSB1 bacterium]